MKVGIIAVHTDYHRRGAHHRTLLQPQIGPLIAGLLPDEADIEVVNDTWTDPDWSRSYDLLFVSAMLSDYERARQIAQYFRARGARTVLGGRMADAYPHLCLRDFDAVVIGDPEDTVPRIYADARAGRLQRLYRSGGYQPDRVPVPRCDLTATQQPAPFGLEVTRGCPFTCDFCALTGSGTRFLTRPVEGVVRDIRAIEASLRGKVPFWRRQMLMFYDNNLAGSFAYLKALCEALAPLGLRWGTCVTFNVLGRRDLLKLMYEAGCRSVFVGLESFNPAAIEGFNKHQNRLGYVRRALETAREEGILVSSGLMLSPQHDDLDYIASLPERLRDSGLHVPSFVCIESALPGTPLFKRLAQAPVPQLMPHASLHDFNAYTLVIRPQKTSPERFVQAYREVLPQIYSLRQRWHKLADDVPRLMQARSWSGVAMDLLVTLGASTPVAPGRTFIPGTDILPPEQVPLRQAHCRDEAHFLDLTSPMAVTDAQGRVLPQWLESSIRVAA